jgi:CRP-like cAMP-binding protein
MSEGNDATRSVLSPMLRKLSLWAQLDPDDERALLDLPHSLVEVGRNKPIVREGDWISHCWLVLSGFCVRQKYVGDGGRQIVSIHMAGDLVDLQNALLGIADHGVQTLTECSMAKLPVDAVRQLTNTHRAIKDALWHDTLVDASIHREWVANLGRRDGPTRIAHLLCEFALKLEAVNLGEQLNYELPMTQDQLADATGLTVVHVNRVLHALTSEGLIERVTPRSVLIGNWKRLAAAGDFRSDYLHLDSLKRRSGYR